MTASAINMPPRPGDRVVSIPPCAAGAGGDCLAIALAVAYGIEYEEMPDQLEQTVTLGEWSEWAQARGLYLWVNSEHCPLELPAWVAMVDGMENGEPHAVAMRRARLLFDPAQTIPEAPFYAHLKRSDVRGALALLPADSPEYTGRACAITNPFPTPERTVSQ